MNKKTISTTALILGGLAATTGLTNTNAKADTNNQDATNGAAKSATVAPTSAQAAYNEAKASENEKLDNLKDQQASEEQAQSAANDKDYAAKSDAAKKAADEFASSQAGALNDFDQSQAAKADDAKQQSSQASHDYQQSQMDTLSDATEQAGQAVKDHEQVLEQQTADAAAKEQKDAEDAKDAAISDANKTFDDTVKDAATNKANAKQAADQAQKDADKQAETDKQDALVKADQDQASADRQANSDNHAANAKAKEELQNQQKANADSQAAETNAAADSTAAVKAAASAAQSEADAKLAASQAALDAATSANEEKADADALVEKEASDKKADTEQAQAIKDAEQKKTNAYSDAAQKKAENDVTDESTASQAISAANSLQAAQDLASNSTASEAVKSAQDEYNQKVADAKSASNLDSLQANVDSAQKAVEEAQSALDEANKQAAAATPVTSEAGNHTISSELNLPTTLVDPGDSVKDGEVYYNYDGSDTSLPTLKYSLDKEKAHEQENDLADYAVTLINSWRKAKGLSPLTWTKDTQNAAYQTMLLRKGSTGKFNNGKLPLDEALPIKGDRPNVKGLTSTLADLGLQINGADELLADNSYQSNPELGAFKNSPTILQLKVDLLNTLTNWLYGNSDNAKKVQSFFGTEEAPAIGFAVQRNGDNATPFSFMLFESYSKKDGTAFSASDNSVLQSTDSIETAREAAVSDKEQALKDAKGALDTANKALTEATESFKTTKVALRQDRKDKQHAALGKATVENADHAKVAADTIKAVQDAKAASLAKNIAEENDAQEIADDNYNNTVSDAKTTHANALEKNALTYNKKLAENKIQADTEKKQHQDAYEQAHAASMPAYIAKINAADQAFEAAKAKIDDAHAKLDNDAQEAYKKQVNQNNQKLADAIDQNIQDYNDAVNNAEKALVVAYMQNAVAHTKAIERNETNYQNASDDAHTWKDNAINAANSAYQTALENIAAEKAQNEKNNDYDMQQFAQEQVDKLASLKEKLEQNIAAYNKTQASLLEIAADTAASDRKAFVVDQHLDATIAERTAEQELADFKQQLDGNYNDLVKENQAEYDAAVKASQDYLASLKSSVTIKPSIKDGSEETTTTDDDQITGTEDGDDNATKDTTKEDAKVQPLATSGDQSKTTVDVAKDTTDAANKPAAAEALPQTGEQTRSAANAAGVGLLAAVMGSMTLGLAAKRRREER